MYNMKLSEIHHKLTLGSIKRYNITEEQIESFETIQDLRKHIRRLHSRSWKKEHEEQFAIMNRAAFKARYYANGRNYYQEHREQILARNRKRYYRLKEERLKSKNLAVPTTSLLIDTDNI